MANPIADEILESPRSQSKFSNPTAPTAACMPVNDPTTEGIDEG